MNHDLDIVYNDGHSQLQVIDSHSNAVLYDLDRASASLDIRATGRSQQPIGCVSFHVFRSKINIETPAGPVSMAKAGKFTKDFTVAAPPDINWRWRRDGTLSKNLKLEDATGAILATFENATLSRSKQGTLTVYNWMSPPEILDLVVMTGLAKIEFNRLEAKKSVAIGVVAGAHASS